MDRIAASQTVAATMPQLIEVLDSIHQNGDPIAPSHLIAKIWQSQGRGLLTATNMRKRVSQVCLRSGVSGRIGGYLIDPDYANELAERQGTKENRKVIRLTLEAEIERAMRSDTGTETDLARIARGFWIAGADGGPALAKATICRFCGTFHIGAEDQHKHLATKSHAANVSTAPRPNLSAFMTLFGGVSLDTMTKSIPHTER